MNLPSPLRASLSSTRTRFRRLPGIVRGLVEVVVLVVVAVILALFIKTFFVQAFYVPSESMYPTLQGDVGLPKDRILVEKPSYWFGTPSRGDIIVFKKPGEDWLDLAESAPPSTGLRGLLTDIGLYPGGDHLVKRVIGVAGDHIVCCVTDPKKQGGKVGWLIINGKAVDEPFTNQTGDHAGGRSAVGGCDGPEFGDCSTTKVSWEVTVPPGMLFVMGDNRYNSRDSAFHINGRGCTPGLIDATHPCPDAFVPVGDVVGKVVAVLWPASRFNFLSRPDTFASIPSPKG